MNELLIFGDHIITDPKKNKNDQLESNIHQSIPTIIEMKKNCFLIILLTFTYISLSAQKDELITVKAGTRILDYFPLSERYLYSTFTKGRVVFKNGIYSERQLNYNFLLGEMEFIQSRDTLAIINKKDIRYVAIDQDTFYYDKGYIKQWSKWSKVIGLKERIELKEIQNKDPYGTASAASSSDSYGSMPMDGNFYKLSANKDMVFHRTRQFYIAEPGGEFILLNRKSLLSFFPGKEDSIKQFLKANKTKFNSPDDMSKLIDFLIKLG